MAAFMPRFMSGSWPTCVREPVFGGGAAIAAAGRVSITAAAMATRALDHADMDMLPPCRDGWRAPADSPAMRRLPGTRNALQGTRHRQRATSNRDNSPLR